MAFSVRRRARDFGIHLSLGAGRSEILRQILWQVGRRVVVGLVLGIAGAVFVLARVASDFLGGIDPGTTALFAGAAAALIGLSAIAGALRPAVIAVRWKPAHLLREE
jgi:ABC-type antimicrobial peptide transport system permease subunit